MGAKYLVTLFMLMGFSIPSYSQHYSKIIGDSLKRIKAYDSLIVWNPNRKLNASDFQGNVDIKDEASALTSCNFIALYDEFNSPRKVLVVCVFEKRKSWAKPHTMNSYALMHEQIHFDIFGLYAKKMTNMANKIFIGNVNAYDSIANGYTLLVKEQTKMQEEFDNATSHKYDQVKQKYWKEKIKKLLSQ